MSDGLIATNKKAYRNFTLSQKWECGIVLNGGEVKSIRAGAANFKDTFARVEKEEVYLYNLHILPYGQASYLNGDPDRVRKLLLHKKEIKKMTAFINEKNMVLIPTRLYFNKRGFIKVELAAGSGKKQYDKREAIKKRDIDRTLKRDLRNRNR